VLREREGGIGRESEREREREVENCKDIANMSVSNFVSMTVDYCI
jgi:hypothetical protein